VKHAAAQMLVQVESARSIVYLAAASVQAGHPDAHLHAAAAKAQVTAEAADTALTLHGAIGYTWEYDLQLYYKRAKLDRVLYGAPSAWNERLAAALDLVPADRPHCGFGQSFVMFGSVQDIASDDRRSSRRCVRGFRPDG
jgi:alkylation response protein AidB-like acyl-CoA dehydrogenase